MKNTQIFILAFLLLLGCRSADKNTSDGSNEPAPKSGGQNDSAAQEIIIDQPKSGATVSAPIKIKGKAKGNWYFEAEFTVALMQNDKKLTETILKAEGDWMTSDFVPFSATMNLPDEAKSGKATLVFKNSNPSGKPELDKTFRLPIDIRPQ